MKNQTQMELELAGANRTPRLQTSPRQPQLSRAQWWFDQMRQVADHAFDWEPAPRFQPEQILLSNGHQHN